MPPAVHGRRATILAGYGASITAEALRWTSQKGAALYLMNRSEEAFSMIGKAMKADHWRRALG
jgi:hypothetical protein